MLKSDTVNIVLLDHSYSCVKKPEINQEFCEDFLSFLPYNMDAALNSDFPESSCSPAYSSDSGIDSIYADLTSELSDFDFNIPSTPLAHSKWIDSVLDGQPLQPEPCGLRSPVNTMAEKKEENLPRSTFKAPNGKVFHGKCMSEENLLEKNRKNADSARENRLKKKKYLEGLEKENQDLKVTHGLVSSENAGLKNTVSALQEEVSYLRSIIANQGTLSLLLKSITSTPGISLSTSFSPPPKPSKEAESKPGNKESTDSRRSSLRKRKMERSENSSTPANKKTNLAKESTASGGICLHVCQERVSLEFCSKCSKNAQASWK